MTMQGNINNQKAVNKRMTLLSEIARLYYIEDLNQQQIANKLNVGRSSIARYLAEAKECGIVQVKIAQCDEAYRNLALEATLKREYRLKDCIVAANVNPANYYIASARYVESILPRNGIIAIGGGATLYSMSQYLNTAGQYKFDNLIFVQPSGFLNESVPSTAVVQAWSMRLGANPVYLSYPGIMRNDTVKRMTFEDEEFIKNLKIAKRADAIVCGIGTIRQFLETGARHDIPFLENESVVSPCVGDICAHLFNAEGDFCYPELSSYVCGLSTLDILRIPVRIASAIGREKAAAIRGALAGRLVNVLMTDEDTVKALLELKN